MALKSEKFSVHSKIKKAGFNPGITVFIGKYGVLKLSYEQNSRCRASKPSLCAVEGCVLPSNRCPLSFGYLVARLYLTLQQTLVFTV